VFITHAQSGDMTREEFRDILAEHGAQGVMIAREAHAEEGHHLHAVCFGSFRSDRLAKALHKAMPGKHVNVLFAHKPKPPKKIGAKWPFFDMVVYITDPKKVKDVDDTPLIWVEERASDLEPWTPEEFCDFYEAKFATPTVKSLMQQLKEAKHAGGTLNDAVEMVVGALDKDTGFSYRGLIEYFQTLPPVRMPLTEAGEEPRGWQVPVVAWALSPCPTGTDGRGMWLHQSSGTGKTWVINYIADQIGDSIFRPGLRPHGGYDAISMMHYNGESLVVLDDIGCSTKDDLNGMTLELWKGAVMDFLKLITSNAPIAFDFGGKRYEVTPKCKVLCTSNFNLPPGRNAEDGAALRRRYIELDAESAEAISAKLNGVQGNGLAPGFNPQV